MAVTEFGVVFGDIENKLMGFDLSTEEDYIKGAITDWASNLNALLVAAGYVPGDVSSTDRLYRMCRQYIINRVAAEVGRSFTHQNPELSDERDKKADRFEKLLEAKPESLSENYDRTKQRGTFRWKKSGQLSTKKSFDKWGGIFDG